ncbi:MAG: GNAT family N-acetyltransferase [Chloroflexi bacterium]|nr:GNAT family N-acetyltransferase [Chloroflexota bacterium]
MAIRIQPLDPGTWPALEALFREGGDPRWCWCQFWRLRSTEFGAAKVPQLRERLRTLAGTDTPPGLVALEGDVAGEDNGDGQGGGVRAVGWVSLGPRTEYERIVRSKVIPKIDDRPVWSIVCFAVSATARGRGVARALLDRAIDHARAQGAEALEAYPLILDGGAGVEPEAAFTGTLPMFERAGFHVVAARASDPSSSRQRVVVRRELR